MHLLARTAPACAGHRSPWRRRRVAVDELVLELVRHRLRLELEHRGLDVLDVAARRRDVLVHVRVAAEDLQRRLHLRERRRRLGPGVADVEERGRGHRVLAVVGQRVADHLDERQDVEHRRFLHHGLDHALQDHVVRELGALGQCQSHVLLTSSSVCCFGA